MAWVERREVVAHVVLDVERHIAPIETRDREVVEILEDAGVRDTGLAGRALALPSALLDLAVATHTGDVRRVARRPQAVEVGEDWIDITGAELAVPGRRSMEAAGAASAAAQVARVRAAAAERALGLALALTLTLTLTLALTLALTLTLTLTLA